MDRCMNGVPLDLHRFCSHRFWFPGPACSHLDATTFIRMKVHSYRIHSAIACLVALNLSLSACKVDSEKSSATAAQEATPKLPEESAPIMVWRGPGEVGYVRVELRNCETSGQITQELVVKSATNLESRTFRGLMLQWPPSITTQPQISQIFVPSPEGMRGNSVCPASVLATLSSDGKLMLYANGTGYLCPAYVLKPND
jgi:hypothetical protein